VSDEHAGRIVWHDHLSDDPGRARRFYEELLGWKVEVWQPGEMDYPMIMTGEQGHGGFGPAQGAPAHWLGHVAVDDVDAAAGRVEEAGGSVLAPPMDIPGVGRMVVVADPQGAAVSLYASEGEWTPSEGLFVWDELLTTDVEDAARFYGEVVGWTAEGRDMGDGVLYTLLNSGGENRAGAFTLPEGSEAPPHWLTYLGTDDVDATAARAAELGATVHMGPTDVQEIGRLAVLQDPLGAYFGIFQPASA
jgi:predicted enzyme related to lactoylglutathione lyase